MSNKEVYEEIMLRANFELGIAKSAQTSAVKEKHAGYAFLLARIARIYAGIYPEAVNGYTTETHGRRGKRANET